MSQRKTTGTDGKTLINERDERLKLILEAAKNAGLGPLPDHRLLKSMDLTGHEVTIPSTVFIALGNVVALVDTWLRSATLTPDFNQSAEGYLSELKKAVEFERNGSRTR